MTKSQQAIDLPTNPSPFKIPKYGMNQDGAIIAYWTYYIHTSEICLILKYPGLWSPNPTYDPTIMDNNLPLPM